MRIVLLSPKGPLYRKRGGIFGQGLRYKPLTLPTLAALVPKDLGASVACLDEGIHDIDPAKIEADLVGMTVITGSAMRAYELADALRRRGIKVVLGGPHVTLIPEDAAPHADSLVVGYAEKTWPQLLRDFKAGAMKPRYDQGADFDLADSPLPDRSVLPTRAYLTEHVFEATRGCVHDCEFCVVPTAWGRRPWQKPVAHVVEDLRRMKSRRALFVDLNLIGDKPYAKELFAALVPLNIQWFGLSTTLLCDDLPLLDLAAKSGCRGLLMGLESIGKANLKASRKGFNRPENYAQVVRRLHERRIALQGCFVFGLDGDTPETFRETAQFAVETGIDLPRFAIATPFPNTGLWKRLLAEDRILHRNWSLYDGQHCVHRPLSMTPQEVESGTETAWKHAYSWANIARRLRHCAAPWPVALATNLGYRHYAHRLHKFYTCDSGMAAWPSLSLPKVFAQKPVAVTVGGRTPEGAGA